MKTIYVGMGLTNAPESFRVQFQTELKTALKTMSGVKILDFIGLAGSTEEEVYTYDRQCTENSDLCVFIADYPSTGLGMEIAFRIATSKPMLVFAKEEMPITRMLTGCCKVENQAFFRYTTADEILSVVETFLKENI